MNPIALIEKYYPPGSDAHKVLLEHSRQVATKAEAIARLRGADAVFVREAALLHDIGIRFTAVPQIGCFGDLVYLCHGIKGREILDREDLPRHALVCERHIGVGLTKEEILARELPLPARDMLPVTPEEQIVTYADLFFSKDPTKAGQEKTVDQVRDSLSRFGAEKVAVFDKWHFEFRE